MLNRDKFAAARKLQGRLDFQGLSISIENRKGGVRKGTDADGSEWRTKMKHPYGYIKGTIGADGEHVDCFIGPDKDAKNAYVAHIKNSETGKYDEDKVMLGFGSKEEAEKSFRHHYDNPTEFLLSIDTMTMEDLKSKLESDRKKGKRSKMLKSAEEAFVDGFIETLEKKAGAGTVAATMIIPTSVLAAIGSTIGALSNKENRGKGALVGAGIGGGMGMSAGIPMGRALSRAIANNKNISGKLNSKIHDAAESIGKRFGEGMASGAKKEMNPLGFFKRKKL